MELKKIKLPLDLPFFEECCSPKERELFDDAAYGIRREVISKNKGKHVLVFDWHKRFIEGILLGNEDHTSYRMVVREGEITLPHHDLYGLWLIK